MYYYRFMEHYDTFSGACPSCFNQFTPIQTQLCTIMFDYDYPSITYVPGMHLPYAVPFVYMYIGQTSCCDSEIDLVCYKTLLCGYRVTVNEGRTLENNIPYQKIPQYNKALYSNHSL